MSLRSRLQRLSERFKPPICPEHLPDTRPRPIDYRQGMEVLCPDPAVRLPALARQAEEIRRRAATPPCPSCGWRPGPMVVVRGVDYGETWRADESEPEA
jgi:hypothetical protein